MGVGVEGEVGDVEVAAEGAGVGAGAQGEEGLVVFVDEADEEEECG